MIRPEERRALEEADRIIWPDLNRQEIEELRCHSYGCQVHHGCRTRAALLMMYRVGVKAGQRGG